MLFKFDYFVELIFKVFGYVGVTLRLAFVTLIIAFILALALAIIRHYEVPVLNNISKVYVSFFRSTPYISQLFLFYFGLAQIFPFVRTMSSSAALIITLAANSFRFTEAYAAALVVYWIVIAILTMFQSKIEAKLKQSY